MCSIRGCKRKVRARTLCYTHWRLARLHGLELPPCAPCTPHHLAKAKLAKHVQNIRKMHASGVPQTEIARLYQVHYNTIYRLVHHETWGEI